MPKVRKGKRTELDQGPTKSSLAPKLRRLSAGESQLIDYQKAVATDEELRSLADEEERRLRPVLASMSREELVEWIVAEARTSIILSRYPAQSRRELLEAKASLNFLAHENVQLEHEIEQKPIRAALARGQKYAPDWDRLFAEAKRIVKENPDCVPGQYGAKAAFTLRLTSILKERRSVPYEITSVATAVRELWPLLNGTRMSPHWLHPGRRRAKGGSGS